MTLPVLVNTLPNSFLSNMKARIAAVEVITAAMTAPTWASITGKPNFHAVAVSGAYADLSGKPTIPTITAQAAIANPSTSVPANAPTNYSALAAILGTDANSTNAKQNQIGQLAGECKTAIIAILSALRANNIVVA